MDKRGCKRVISEKPNPAVLDMVDMILRTAGKGRAVAALMEEVGGKIGFPGFAEAVSSEMGLVRYRWRELHEMSLADDTEQDDG